MWILLCLIGVATFLFWIITSPFYWKRRNVPYLTPVPILGSFLPMFKLGVLEFNNYLYQKFPGERFYGMHFFTRPALFIKDPELVHKIMITDFEYFTSHGVYGNQDRDPGGGNIFTIHGQQWKEMRSKLSPYFSPARVKTMLSYADGTLTKLISTIEDNIKNNKPTDFKSALMNVTLDITTKALFGIETDTFSNKDSLFNKIASEMFKPKLTLRIFISIISPKLYDLLRVSSFGTETTKQIVDILTESWDCRRKENIHLQDFLQGMMEMLDSNDNLEQETAERQRFFPDKTRVPCYDRNTLFSQALILFAAGIETSALTMTFFLYQVAIHPEIQDKCRQEINSIVEEIGGEITAADVNKLTYLEAALQETLRYYSPFSMLTRECTKDYKIPDSDVIIEKGTLILIQANGTHMDPKYFHEPESFKPDRFMDNNKIQRGTFYPFGLGPRICLGMGLANNEMKLVLSRLLQSYELSVCSQTIIPLKIGKFFFLTTPAEEVWLDVRPIAAVK